MATTLLSYCSRGLLQLEGDCDLEIANVLSVEEVRPNATIVLMCVSLLRCRLLQLVLFGQFPHLVALCHYLSVVGICHSQEERIEVVCAQEVIVERLLFAQDGLSLTERLFQHQVSAQMVYHQDPLYDSQDFGLLVGGGGVRNHRRQLDLLQLLLSHTFLLADFDDILHANLLETESRTLVEPINFDEKFWLDLTVQVDEAVSVWLQCAACA